MDPTLFEIAPAPHGWADRRQQLRRLAERLLPATVKGRIVIGALSCLVAGVTLTALYLDTVAEVELIKLARQREQLEVTRTAASMARRINELHGMLQMVAAQIDAPTLDDPRRLEALFEREPVLRGMFANFAVARADGTVLLVHDQAGARYPKLNLGDRDYFRRTIQENRALVSAGIPGRISNEPIVMLTQPIVGAAGVLGMVGGTLRLASRDLLADLADPLQADGGTMVVVADGQGQIVAHPQRARLLEPVSQEPRLRQAHEEWVIEEAPGLRDGRTWLTDDAVVAMAGEAQSGWQVWRVASRASLLAPLHDVRLRVMLIGTFVAVVLAMVLMAFITRQLRPLKDLEKRAARLLEGDAEGGWPESRGEIGQLSRTLRHVWAERTQMEGFNAQVLQKLSSVMDASPIGLAFTRHRRWELVSAELCRMLHRSEDTLVGQPTEGIFASFEDYQRLGELVGAAFAAGQLYVGEWQLVRADGEVFWSRLRAGQVSPGDPSAGTVWSLYDISDQVHSRTQLEHAVLHDALTGVLNRKGFEAHAAAAFEPGEAERQHSMVMIDLDRFKPINDSAGHAAGDAMLKAVAQAIAAHVRASDAVARLGGDEFAMLLRGCDQPRAVAVAEKVREAINEIALPWQGQRLQVGASFGVATLTAGEHASVAEWLAAADAACYAAKRGGRDRVVSAQIPLKLVAVSAAATP